MRATPSVISRTTAEKHPCRSRWSSSTTVSYTHLRLYQNLYGGGEDRTSDLFDSASVIDPQRPTDPSLYNLSLIHIYFVRGFTLHTKLVLTTTVILLFGGALLILALDWNNASSLGLSLIHI